MPESAAVGKIADSEVILRRIPVSKNWYDDASQVLLRDALIPRSVDADGLSVTRARSAEHPEFLTIEEVGFSGCSKAGYWVAALAASDIRALGLDLVPDPIPPGNAEGLPPNLGHVIIPQIRYAVRATDEVVGWTKQLAERFAADIRGPFLPIPEK